MHCSCRFLRYTPKELKDYGGGPKVQDSWTHSSCSWIKVIAMRHCHSACVSTHMPAPVWHGCELLPIRPIVLILHGFCCSSAPLHNCCGLRQEIFLTYIAPCHYNAIRRRTSSLPRIFALSRSTSSIEAAMKQADKQGLPRNQVRAA